MLSTPGLTVTLTKVSSPTDKDMERVYIPGPTETSMTVISKRMLRMEQALTPGQVVTATPANSRTT